MTYYKINIILKQLFNYLFTENAVKDVSDAMCIEFLECISEAMDNAERRRNDQLLETPIVSPKNISNDFGDDELEITVNYIDITGLEPETKAVTTIFKKKPESNAEAEIKKTPEKQGKKSPMDVEGDITSNIRDKPTRTNLDINIIELKGSDTDDEDNDDESKAEPSKKPISQRITERNAKVLNSWENSEPITAPEPFPASASMQMSSTHNPATGESLQIMDSETTAGTDVTGTGRPPRREIPDSQPNGEPAPHPKKRCRSISPKFPPTGSDDGHSEPITTGPYAVGVRKSDKLRIRIQSDYLAYEKGLETPKKPIWNRLDSFELETSINDDYWNQARFYQEIIAIAKDRVPNCFPMDVLTMAGVKATLKCYNCQYYNENPTQCGQQSTILTWSEMTSQDDWRHKPIEYPLGITTDAEMIDTSVITLNWTLEYEYPYIENVKLLPLAESIVIRQMRSIRDAKIADPEVVKNYLFAAFIDYNVDLIERQEAKRINNEGYYPRGAIQKSIDKLLPGARNFTTGPPSYCNADRFESKATMETIFKEKFLPKLKEEQKEITNPKPVKIANDTDAIKAKPALSKSQKKKQKKKEKQSEIDTTYKKFKSDLNAEPNVEVKNKFAPLNNLDKNNSSKQPQVAAKPPTGATKPQKPQKSTVKQCPRHKMDYYNCECHRVNKDWCIDHNMKFAHCSCPVTIYSLDATCKIHNKKIKLCCDRPKIEDTCPKHNCSYKHCKCDPDNVHWCGIHKKGYSICDCAAQQTNIFICALHNKPARLCCMKSHTQKSRPQSPPPKSKCQIEHTSSWKRENCHDWTHKRGTYPFSKSESLRDLMKLGIKERRRQNMASFSKMPFRNRSRSSSSRRRERTPSPYPRHRSSPRSIPRRRDSRSPDDWRIRRENNRIFENAMAEENRRNREYMKNKKNYNNIM